MTWEDKLIEDVVILEWCLGYSTQTGKQECGIFQKDLDYAHIPMYAVIGVKPTYVRGYQVKSCVYHFLYSFRDDQGNIKGKKMVHGV